MCLWPLCFMVTGQGFCARGRNSLETSAAVLCSASRPQVKGLLTGAANFVLLLKANTHTHTQGPHNIHASVVKLTSQGTQTHRHSECSCVDSSGDLSILALIVLFYALAQGSLWAYMGRGWMRMHAWSSDRGLLVDRWEGGGPLQPGHCSSVSCGVAVDCSYYIIQVDHCRP